MEDKILVISKPIVNNILPLVDFPKNKENYNLNATIFDIAGEANIAAYILGKYNLPVSLTGIIGNDETGNVFKETYHGVNVDLKYIETNYDEKTNVLSLIHI